MVVIAVKEPPLLHPVQRHVAGVKVQHQLRRRVRERLDEQIEQHAVQRPGHGAVGAPFQPAQRRRTGQRLIASDRRLQQRVRAQRAVIVQILVAQRQAKAALPHHVLLRVPHPARIARIGQHRRRAPAQSQPLIDPPQQQRTAVRTHVPAIERRLHRQPANPPKRQLPLGTLCHQRLLRKTGLNRLI